MYNVFPNSFTQFLLSSYFLQGSSRHWGKSIQGVEKSKYKNPKVCAWWEQLQGGQYGWKDVPKERIVGDEDSEEEREHKYFTSREGK